MANINIPQRRSSGGGDGGLGSLLTLGGAGLGAFLAPVGGGVAGASLGASLGGATSGLLNSGNSQGSQPSGPAPVGKTQDVGSAIDRRLEALDATPQGQIRQSINSLQYIQDPAERAELAKPLFQADYMMRKQGPGGQA